MFGELYGPFNNHTEVLQGIHELKEKGYKSKEIILLADTRDHLYFEKKEKVHFQTLEERSHFLQTMKRVIGRGKQEIEGIIGEEDLYGVTQEEKEKYYEKLKEGKIYLFISPEKLHYDAEMNDSSMDIDSYYEDAWYRINTRGL